MDYTTGNLSLNDNFKYAEFWKRLLAYIIDGMIVNIFSMILYIPAYLYFIFTIYKYENMNSHVIINAEAQSEKYIAIIILFIIVIVFIAFITLIASWLYFALMESSKKQATLGKMALNIIVVDMQGKRISFGRASGRYFAKIISGMILYVGFIMAAFTEKRQALHDIIAGTLTIEK